MAVVEITKENFEKEVLQSELPVLVDFFATWCGPCKMLSPIVDQLAEELAGTVKVGKVDIDGQIDLARKFRVMSVPTLVVFKNGKVTSQTVGVQTAEQIKKNIMG